MSEPEPEGGASQALRARLSRMAGWQDRFQATPPEERTGLLLAFGFSAVDLARIVQSSEDDRLDGVCGFLGDAVANATYDEAGIVSWLRAPNAHLGDRCPLDVMCIGDLQAVRDAWALDVEVVAVDDAALWSIPGRRGRRPSHARRPG